MVFNWNEFLARFQTRKRKKKKQKFFPFEYLVCILYPERGVRTQKTTVHPRNKRTALKVPKKKMARRKDIRVDSGGRKQLRFLGSTPPKTNMEPENEALEEEISIRKPSFFRFHFSFLGSKIKSIPGSLQDFFSKKSIHPPVDCQVVARYPGLHLPRSRLG